MLKSKYCYIVAATQTYLPELVANLNSLEYVGNKNDVHLIGLELEDSFLNQLPKLNYNVIHHNITEAEWQADHGRSEVVCRKRYWFANEYGKDYAATCVLDADLIWVRNPENYFTIAEKTGFILGPNKEQNKVYNDPHHQFNGEWLIQEGFYNDKDLCNCPLFLDANVWGQALTDQWRWFKEGFPDTNMKCPDMDCMNIAFLKYGSYDKTILLAGNQWLMTNEQGLKPYIRVVEDRGLIKTESGIPVYSYHGQFFHKKWRECQLENRHNCAAGYLKADKHPEVIANLDNQARGSMDLLYGYFKRMLSYAITIEMKNYRHPELPYEL